MYKQCSVCTSPAPEGLSLLRLGESDRQRVGDNGGLWHVRGAPRPAHSQSHVPPAEHLPKRRVLEPAPGEGTAHPRHAGGHPGRSTHRALGRIIFLFWWTPACQHIVLTQLRSTEINYKHTSDAHFQGITDNIYDLFTFFALIAL